jgi:hypothetical protein
MKSVTFIHQGLFRLPELTCCGLVGYANVTLLNVTSAIREWYGILLPPARGIDVSKFIN